MTGGKVELLESKYLIKPLVPAYSEKVYELLSQRGLMHKSFADWLPLWIMIHFENPFRPSDGICGLTCFEGDQLVGYLGEIWMPFIVNSDSLTVLVGHDFCRAEGAKGVGMLIRSKISTYHPHIPNVSISSNAVGSVTGVKAGRSKIIPSQDEFLYICRPFATLQAYFNYKSKPRKSLLYKFLATVGGDLVFNFSRSLGMKKYPVEVSKEIPENFIKLGSSTVAGVTYGVNLTEDYLAWRLKLMRLAGSDLLWFTFGPRGLAWIRISRANGLVVWFLEGLYTSPDDLESVENLLSCIVRSALENDVAYVQSSLLRTSWVKVLLKVGFRRRRRDFCCCLIKSDSIKEADHVPCEFMYMYADKFS